MTTWTAVLLALGGTYLAKFAGYLVPQRILEHPLVKHIALLLPVALLAAIVTVQAVTSERSIVVDARLPGIVVAMLLLARRANFLLVVLGAAATTAVVRALGWLA